MDFKDKLVVITGGAQGIEAPLAVLGSIAERGIEPQERFDVVNTLNGLGLEKRIEDELDVVLL